MKPQEWRQELGDCVRDLFLLAGDGTFLFDAHDD